MKKRGLLALLVIVSLLLALVACAKPTKPTTPTTTTPTTTAPIKVIRWNLHTGYSNAANAAACYPIFVDMVKQYTGGQLQIDILWAGASGYKGGEIVRVLREGLLPIGEIQSSYIAAEVAPWMGIGDFLGYMWQNPAQQLAYYDRTRPKFMDTMTKQGVVPLNMETFPWDETGTSALTVNKEIKGLNDLKGLKLRLHQKLVGDYAFKPMGIAPVVLAGGEIYMAMKTGLIDGTWGPNMSDSLLNKWNEVGKYIYVFSPGTGGTINSLCASKSAFDALPPDVQQGLLKAGKDFETKFMTEIRKDLNKFFPGKSEMDSMKELQRLGAIVKKMPAEIRTEFDRLLVKGLNEWAVQVGADANIQAELFLKVRTEFPGLKSPVWDALAE